MEERPFLPKLILPFAMMIAIVVAICGASVYWAGQRNVRLQQIRDLDRLVRLVKLNMPQLDAQLSAGTEQRLRDLGEVLETRITLISPDGTVAFDTHHDPGTMDNHNARPEVQQARAEGVGSSVRKSDSINENAVYAAQLLDPAKPAGAVLRLSYPEHVWARFGVPIWLVVVAGAFMAILLLVWLAIVLQRQWIGPVQHLAGAVDQLVTGKWDTRVEPGGADVVRSLGSRVNVLAATAQKQLTDLKHQRADLQALVDSLPDPILLTDATDHIIVINSPAARLLQLKPADALGKKIVAVCNEETILRALEQARVEPAAVTREIRLQRNGQRVTFQAVVQRAGAGGLLLVLRNVSALAAAVQMKTDFVANASHELRTPIAAIKVAFETLREVYSEDPDQTARCVTIIGGHLNRLEEMLSDLLDLSRVESQDLKPHIAPIAPGDLSAHVRATMGAAANTKNIELHFDSSHWTGGEDFNTDARLVNLILKNLVENSIKFTPAGGRVSLVFERPDAQSPATLRVSDTGIGIPPQHQARVFERFYQVDPARSGSAGRGTGLGLAIVKHAVHALGGSIDLTSEPGQGTTVAIHLPPRTPTLDHVDE